ncbi:MAG: translation elongation factor-like protein [Candidatus Aenigmarchaeota archaeon]|nr:translation elongation factor-like protein [Candidatus Aenigmarchaeota archaeon]
MEEKKLIGKVTHYYNKIGVAIIELSDDIQHGDVISIEGPSTNIQETADSMQVEHKTIKAAHRGDAIGMKVKDIVRPGDNVYRVVE